jgi:hypothetical protein
MSEFERGSEKSRASTGAVSDDDEIVSHEYEDDHPYAALLEEAKAALSLTWSALIASCMERPLRALLS